MSIILYIYCYYFIIKYDISCYREQQICPHVIFLIVLLLLLPLLLISISTILYIIIAIALLLNIFSYV